LNSIKILLVNFTVVLSQLNHAKVKLEDEIDLSAKKEKKKQLAKVCIMKFHLQLLCSNWINFITAWFIIWQKCKGYSRIQVTLV